MRVILKTLICLCAALILANVSEAKEWRGIVPMHSTRADVERLLGPLPKDYYAYNLPNERVVFEFAEQPCNGKDDSRWDVPSGTVTVIAVIPKALLKLEDLNLDLSKFKKRPGGSDTPDLFYYANEDEGFSISVGNGIVSEFIYSATSKDEHLRCPGPPTSILQCEQLKVKLAYPREPVLAGKPVTIKATVETDDPYFLSQTAYNWIITDPDVKVISGYGKPELVIDTTGLTGRIINVRLWLLNTPPSCKHSLGFQVISIAQENDKVRKNKYSP
jgi:hypothetical protein